jgi:DNA ligase-1
MLGTAPLVSGQEGGPAAGRRDPRAASNGAPAASQVDAAPPLLLAKVLSSTPLPAGFDPANYLVSEKLDGVRAYWDGRVLRFRSGQPIRAPAWFVGRLPAVPLDGELWLGRRRFDELSGIVRKDPAIDREWRGVSFHVFELPGAPGSFEERYARIRALVQRVGWVQLRAVEQARVADRGSLRRRLDEVVRAGGEGLMLHRADAPYVTGRSDALLKLKPLLDSEAVVVAHLPGRGRHQGVLGALVVRSPEGTRFRIGTGFSDAQRRDPPPVGASVTYAYRGLTPAGVPRFASFVRVRELP